MGNSPAPTTDREWGLGAMGRWGDGEMGRWGTHRPPRPTGRSQCGGRVSRHKAPGVGD
ncbi:hypothetical protein [Fischerella sp. FACHB-380]|uniref:hypothetical protein n=1 Tax=Fischerella sp. FACHB-380 TaxID=2692799 RepID=UPI0012F8D9AD|nr:hypothetical protein [Fischerella sp. FACHB-380]MBD2434667.1 hypothetical protein [Fischerella sp. FACHB-380]